MSMSKYASKADYDKAQSSATKSDTPRTNALADRYGDIDPDSPYWEALSLATVLEREVKMLEAETRALWAAKAQPEHHHTPQCYAGFGRLRHRVCGYATNAEVDEALSAPSETATSSNAKFDEAFDVFRQYWNHCERDNIPPEFGRVFAIFADALRSSPSATVRGTEADELLKRWLKLLRDPQNHIEDTTMLAWATAKHLGEMDGEPQRG